MVKNFATYIILTSDSLASGVKKKALNTISVLNKEGYESKSIFLKSFGVSSYLLLFKYLILCDSTKIILRFPGPLRTILIFPIIIFKRIQGKQLILDNPTPLKSIFWEILKSEEKLSKYFNIILILIFYPWVFFPYSRILQYGHESAWFSIGLKNKTKLVGNGIDTSIIPKINESKVANNCLKLIVVASIHFWHGLDRLIEGLNDYYNNYYSREQIQIELTIVGGGEGKNSLEEKVKNSKLENFISFTNYLSGTDLDLVFEDKHIAVGSLGLFRLGLESASPLKNREYVSRGLPVILGARDLDFSEELPFVFYVPNNSSPINFVDVIQWYGNFVKSAYSSEQIRDFAIERLDFKVKIYEMFID